MGSGTVSTQREHTYIAIDLKSFYASVECVARGLDPLPRIWWWPMKPAPIRQYVWRSHPR